MDPVVIGFYGKSNTGKTSLIVKLIGKLTDEGFTVATIKNTDKKIGMDTGGKDTWKCSQAGARLVVLSSLCETDFIVKESMNTKKILKNISDLGCYDIVLIEGVSDPGILKIKVGDIEERKNTICCYKGNVDEILEIIKKEIDKKTKNQKMSILVNGKNIPLTGFPSEIIKNTVVGMLTSLKGVNEIKEVEIRFKN